MLKEQPAEKNVSGASPSENGNADVPQTAVNDAEFTDPQQAQQGNEQAQAQTPPQTEPAPPAKPSDKPEKPAQEKSAEQLAKEQNAENARKRREAERQKELQKVRTQTIIDTLNGKNPYTGEPMKDQADVDEYMLMKQIEKDGGDPVADYAKYRKAKEREARAAEEERKDREDWFKNDYTDFVAKNPTVDVQELISDEAFKAFADGKVGKVPLTDIYAAYTAFQKSYEDKARKKAAQLLANQKTSPGALSGADGAESGFFTREQVEKMSKEDVTKYYDKIMTSMKKW